MQKTGVLLLCLNVHVRRGREDQPDLLGKRVAQVMMAAQGQKGRREKLANLDFQVVKGVRVNLATKERGVREESVALLE